MKRIISILLALVLVVSMTACGGGTTPTTTVGTSNADSGTTASSGEGTEGGDAADEALDAAEGKYTYRVALSAGPQNWNPHSWELNVDNTVIDYLTTPLVNTDVDEENNTWKWVYDAATDISDYTKEFKDKEKFGLPADATEGYVYKIELNPAMQWENGDKITADDYVYSTQQLLSSEMKNYRANNFISGTSEIKNAKLYFENDKANKPIYKPLSEDTPADAPQYFSLKESVTFFGKSAESYYKQESHKAKFVVDGTDLFEKYSATPLIEINDDTKVDMLAIAKAFGDENPEAWKEFVIFDTGEIFPKTPWEDVGLVKVDDYTILYILARPVSQFYFNSAMTSAWLVHKDTYEKYKEKKGDLVATSYATDMNKTMSYGPYKFLSYEKDKQLRFARNENWGGYTDGKHEGEYVATDIVFDIIPNHATELQRFGQGLIDEVGLTADDIEKYKKSDRLYTTDLSYTARYIFATSRDSLSARDAEKGSGKRIVLSYKDFRKALSLSIDREKYCREATSMFKPAYFLINRLYYYNIENDPDSVYRDSKQAKREILRLYGVEAADDKIDEEYNKITGRDVEQARALFQKAYEEAKAAGDYNDGDEVPIEIMVHPKELIPQHKKQEELMNEFVLEATKGTGFEGKVKIVFEAGDDKRYENVALGKNMAIHGAWGGAAFYPFQMIQSYTNTEYMGGLTKIHESNGWDPSKETVELTFKKDDGTVVTDTKTYQDWSKTINGDGEYVSNVNDRLSVLAALERAVLETYQCIPLGAYTDATLLSYKIDYAVQDYNIMYGYGGVKNLKFNYDDKAWAEYVKENKGKLNYE